MMLPLPLPLPLPFAPLPLELLPLFPLFVDVVVGVEVVVAAATFDDDVVDDDINIELEGDDWDRRVDVAVAVAITPPLVQIDRFVAVATVFSVI